MCSPVCCIARPIINPPINKNIIGWLNPCAVCFIELISKMGKITNGTKPVAGRGMASDNHQDAISKATPKVNQAL